VAAFTIRREAQSTVVGVGGRIISFRVAARTIVRCIVVIAKMASGTIVGNHRMSSFQSIEIIVDIESGRIPARLRRVTAFAIRRQTQCRVIGIRGGIIRFRVAARTLIWRIVVIPKMAGRTIVRYRCMSAFQHIKIIVDIESGRIPARLRGVAAFAVRREAQRRVVGVHRLGIIRCVAARTSIGRIAEITASVACRTIISDGRMRPGQDIKIIVIEGRWRPAYFCMATFAVRREACACVIGVARCIIGIRVAAITRIFRIAKHSTRMACPTIVGYGSMCAIQDVEIIVNI